jgi:hypothetical protein
LWLKGGRPGGIKKIRQDEPNLINAGVDKNLAKDGQKKWDKKNRLKGNGMGWIGRRAVARRRRFVRSWSGYGGGLKAAAGDVAVDGAVERAAGNEPGNYSQNESGFSSDSPLPRGADDPTIAVVVLPGGRRLWRRVRERP